MERQNPFFPRLFQNVNAPNWWRGSSFDTHTRLRGLQAADAGFRNVVAPVGEALIETTALKLRGRKGWKGCQGMSNITFVSLWLDYLHSSALPSARPERPHWREATAACPGSATLCSSPSVGRDQWWRLQPATLYRPRWQRCLGLHHEVRQFESWHQTVFRKSSSEINSRQLLGLIMFMNVDFRWHEKTKCLLCCTCGRKISAGISHAVMKRLMMIIPAADCNRQEHVWGQGGVWLMRVHSCRRNYGSWFTHHD